VAYLAREHHITVTVGMSTTEWRWGGGTALIGPGGTPVAVLSPVSGLVRGEAFRLLAGMLLLFETTAEQQRFDRNTRRRRKVPIDGWRMEHIRRRWPRPRRPRPGRLPHSPSARTARAAARNRS